jgi:hypothetical protein
MESSAETKARLSEMRKEADWALLEVRPWETGKSLDIKTSGLMQMSSEEIDFYLKSRVLCAQWQGGHNPHIKRDELYVVYKNVRGGKGFKASCLPGTRYFEPLAPFPSSSQLKEMWSYSLLTSPRGEWCEFQAFVERAIKKALLELHRFEKRVKQEIIPIDYAMQAKEAMPTLAELLFEQAKIANKLITKASQLKKHGAPFFMQTDNAAQLQFHKIILRALRRIEL